MSETLEGAAAAATDRAPLLVLEKLDKSFGATHALKAVDLTFEEGEIHAIVGENGAGKSTLIKVLTGVHPRTSGEVLLARRVGAAGQSARGDRPRHQRGASGSRAVPAPDGRRQHLPRRREDPRRRCSTTRRWCAKAQKLLDDLGFSLPAGAVLSSLTIGQQQLIATARAERRGAKFLIFDEPTAYLTRQEAAALFKLIRRLKASGVTIVYISHRLEEVFELCDRVSVLRDGALVGTREVGETNEADLIALMINRTIEQIYHKDSVPIGETILETDKLSGPGFHDVSITVREGEIVGLYGLIGAGRSEFVQSVFGRQPAAGGRIVWRGKDVKIRNERQAMDLGIALSPESRRDQGLCLHLGVGLNINLPIFKRLSVGPFINLKREASAADRQIRDVQIKTAARNAPVTSLSGGNQQKVVIGKWLNHGAKLFIFDEPTVGVDVGTKAEIYRLLGSLLQQGAGIIMISSYLPEVYELADTLHVFRGGTIVATPRSQGRLARGDPDRGDRRLNAN